MTETSTPADDGASAGALAAGVLAEEERRAAERTRKKPETVLPDDLLPGVGEEQTTLREGVRKGGWWTIIAIGFAQSIDSFDNIALSVLAPDIQRSLGASDAVMGAIAGAFGVLFLLGSIPLSTLADRYPRKVVAASAMSVWGVVVFLTGMVQNAFWLFGARMATGMAQSYSLPVNNPLLIDTYPIQARGRIFALNNAFQMMGQIIAPLFVGAVTVFVSGDDSWRWSFFLIGLLSIPVVIGLAGIPEPRRGRNEMRSVLGRELDEDKGELPISLGVAFERLKKIKTFHFFLVGMAALGFAMFSVPLFLNLFLDEEMGLDAMQRGLLTSVIVIPGFATVAIAGRRSDSLFRDSPPKSVIFIGGLIASFGVFIVIALFMPNIWTLGLFLAIGMAMSRAAFTVVAAAIASVIPYRLRSRGTAMVGIYIFLFGGFFGAVFTGVLSDYIGRRGAIALVVLPSALIGGALIAYSARYIRRDISLVVEELQEEQAEHDRMQQPDALVPVVQVRNLDFSYGSVQVLFDVNLDVHRGETVALLGTNGAGKSTLLRVISGLGVAERGVVRLNGRTITYVDPEPRVRAGVVQLMGGKAVFPNLSVQDNLKMAGYLLSAAALKQRTEHVLGYFPQLADRRDALAGDLSGGQQQMLALCMALVHEPEVLIIDELSIGLAPIVVQDLLEVIRRLKADGQTMIIVEQSLNVALAISDRAVFMEKGSIRFEGPAAELMERDDLARAVFLGGTT